MSDQLLVLFGSCSCSHDVIVFTLMHINETNVLTVF